MSTCGLLEKSSEFWAVKGHLNEYFEVVVSLLRITFQRRGASIESEICGLSKEELIKMTEHVRVNTEGLRVSKRFREQIETEIEKYVNKKALLQELSKVIDVEPPPSEVQDNENNSVSKNQSEEMPEQVDVKKQPAKQPEPVVTNAETNFSVDIAKAFRHDFTIFGTIGSDSHKDLLSFFSLVRQTDVGIKTGYKERKVIEAVIRSVNPSLKLRTYLEMMSELSLSRLKQILIQMLISKKRLPPNFNRN